METPRWEMKPTIEEDDHSMRALEEEYQLLAIDTRATIEEARKSWESDFTDPVSHDDKKFCYLVHALSSDQNVVMIQYHLLKENKHDPAKNIDLREEPERIAEKEKISTSIIDQDHRETYGDVGLVLDVPFDNVVNAFHMDGGTGFGEDSFRFEQFQQQIPTVREILDATAPQGYNEIMLKGTTHQGKVAIKAVWVMEWDDRELVDEQMYDKALDISHALKVPIITVVKERIRRVDTRPEVEKDHSGKPFAFAFERNNLRYWLNFERGDFDVIDDKNQCRPMERSEFVFALDILKSELDVKDQSELSQLVEGLSEMFAKIEYCRQNPLPEVLTDYRTKRIYAFALERNDIRYLVDIKKNELYKYVREYGSYNDDPYGWNIDSDEPMIIKQPMDRSEFEFVKQELLNSLEGESLESFKSKLPELEKALSQ